MVRKSFAALLSELLNHPDTPVEIYNDIRDSINSQDVESFSNSPEYLSLVFPAIKGKAGTISQDESKGFVVTVPLTLEFMVGRDPSAWSKARVTAFSTIELLFLCESLFWTVKQLGNVLEYDSWVFRKSSLAEALSHIGTLGAACSEAASEHTQHLEKLAEAVSKEETASTDRSESGVGA